MHNPSLCSSTAVPTVCLEHLPPIGMGRASFESSHNPAGDPSPLHTTSPKASSFGKVFGSPRYTPSHVGSGISQAGSRASSMTAGARSSNPTPEVLQQLQIRRSQLMHGELPVLLTLFTQVQSRMVAVTERQRSLFASVETYVACHQNPASKCPPEHILRFRFCPWHPITVDRTDMHLLALIQLALQDGFVLEQNFNSALYYGQIKGKRMWKGNLSRKIELAELEEAEPEPDVGPLEQLFRLAPVELKMLLERSALVGLSWRTGAQCLPQQFAAAGSVDVFSIDGVELENGGLQLASAVAPQQRKGTLWWCMSSQWIFCVNAAGSGLALIC
eukprot:scaffold61850_cov21-Tisochrysis_lutea.AAC.5